MINQQKNHSILKVILLSYILLTLLFIAGCNSQSTETQTSAKQVNINQTFTNVVVSFPAEVHPEPITARILLLLSRDDFPPPMYYFGASNSRPVYAIDVTNLLPEEEVVFSRDKFSSPDALAFPEPIDQLEQGTYYAQALIDLDDTVPRFFSGPGNLYSQVIECDFPMSTFDKLELVTDQVIEGLTPPEDTDRIKLVEIRSKLLSDFYGRDFYLRAGVVLPEEYNEIREQHFPTLYSVPDFGGDYRLAWEQQEESSLQFIQVYLDPQVPLGHSVFADSVNNGPCGQALIQELIPEIEKRFRAIPHAYSRFVTGHSSGGWSSLWLQMTYPDFFGGCWSLAPDPVDFRAFTTINIYEDINKLWTREGNIHWAYVVGSGFQSGSFNAVFSPSGTDGKPRPIMDPLTGIIDTEVAEYWKNYDIRLILEDSWSSLGPKLKGKIHVIAGASDNFHLNTAVEYLNDFLETTDYGGYVEIHPGDHGSFVTRQLRERIEMEMAEQFAAGQKEFEQENNMQSQ